MSQLLSTLPSVMFLSLHHFPDINGEQKNAIHFKLKSCFVQTLDYRKLFIQSHLSAAKGHVVTTALQEMDFLTL